MTGVFKWKSVSEGKKDTRLSNGIIVAEEAIKFSKFYAISEIRKEC